MIITRAMGDTVEASAKIIKIIGRPLETDNPS
jgi:hypothetical protein